MKWCRASLKPHQAAFCEFDNPEVDFPERYPDGKAIETELTKSWTCLLCDPFPRKGSWESCIPQGWE